MNDLSERRVIASPESGRDELQAQLYRYAEDMYQLMSEHDALQQRFRTLDQAHRSVLEYRDLLSLLMHSVNEAYVATDEAGIVLGHTLGAKQLLGTDDPVGRPLSAFLADDGETAAWIAAPATVTTAPSRQVVLANGPAGRAQLLRCAAPDKSRHHWVIRPQIEHGDRLPLDPQEDSRACGIFVCDRDGRIVAINSGFEGFSGRAAGATSAASLQDLLRRGGDDFARQLWEQLRIAGNWQGEIINRRRSGETYPEWLAIESIQADGGIVGYFGKLHDLSRLQDSERELSRLAYYDVLTGLPNRHLFNDRLSMALRQSRREERQMALMFIDLDRFKQINDTLGHDIGDELLKIVAERLRSATREADTVARLGGDEFTVILPRLLGERDVHAVAAKILETFQPPIQIGHHTLFAAPSIGIALFPDHGGDASTLLRHADSAMYRAKNNGGNVYHLYETEDDGDTRVLNLESAFRNALERRELHLVYQPQVAASGDRLDGVEALLRWRSPEFGDISPEVFIPIAEWSGMVVEIGQWVLRSACRQAADWRQAGLPIGRVAVNISPRQLRAPDFPRHVLDALAFGGLPGEALELEITESELMLHPDSTLAKLAELRGHGISIAVDDFGTGYSSLARLRSLPIDRIKVDRSFIRDLEHDSDAQAISACIVTMARVMNLEVIAEGVETAGQLHHLVEQGCHSIQGYFFARPMPPEHLAGWLTSMPRSKEEDDEPEAP